MLVAYWRANHEPLLSIFSDPGKFYATNPYSFLFASLMLLILGAGLFSVMRWSRKAWKWRVEIE